MANFIVIINWSPVITQPEEMTVDGSIKVKTQLPYPSGAERQI